MSEKTNEETSAKDSGLIELGEASVETRGMVMGNHWDDGINLRTW